MGTPDRLPLESVKVVSRPAGPAIDGELVAAIICRCDGLIDRIGDRVEEVAGGLADGGAAGLDGAAGDPQDKFEHFMKKPSKLGETSAWDRVWDDRSVSR
jgi:hypothetical protein